MLRTSIAFFSGQAATCLLFIAGARLQPLNNGIIAGALTTVIAALLFARQTARLLTSLADAAAAFQRTWRAARATPHATTAAARLASVTLSQIQRDVVSALCNLGESESKATRKVLAVAAGPADDFESLLRKAIA